ncbi:MAG: hypothetical protein M1326_06515 [Cyanobacteria bacterium]|nr:hypothetical protein [Cyanobacteriota bacterium]
MEGRERLLKTFRGEVVDRIPIAPFLNFNAIYRHFDIPPEKQNWRGNHNLVEKAIEFSDYFGFDQLQRLGTPVHQYDEKSSNNGKWIVSVDFKKINGRDTEITTIKTPEKILTQIKEFNQTTKYTYIEAIREHYIKTRDDFNQFIKYQPPFEDSIYRSIKDEFENLSIAKRLLEDRGVVLGFAGGAYNMLNNYRNLELIMMDPYLDSGFYKEMIQFFSIRVKNIIKKLVEHGADLVEMGGNLATGGVGELFFKSHVSEYEKELADYIRQLGAFSIYHNCGDADKIMHLYNNMGIDSWGYLTPLPYGDVDLDNALKIIDRKIVLLGNIDQIDFLKKATPAQIKEKVKEVLGKVKKRGNFILSTSDWWTDDMPYENLKAFADAGIEFGHY